MVMIKGASSGRLGGDNPQGKAEQLRREGSSSVGGGAGRRCVPVTRGSPGSPRTEASHQQPEGGAGRSLETVEEHSGGAQQASTSATSVVQEHREARPAWLSG